MTRLRPIATLTLAITLHGVADATELQSLDEIRGRAVEFATQQRDISGGERVVEAGMLDPRLRLSRCTYPLSAEPLGQQRNGANITVTVKCQGEKPWSVHVPVRISTYVAITIAAEPLPRGVAIPLTSLRQERRDINQLNHGHFAAPELVAGRIPRRALPTGAVVTPGDLELERVILRGSKVAITATANGITVQMPGKALDDAAAGESLRVENLSSKRVVEATAVRAGVVEIPM